MTSWLVVKDGYTVDEEKTYNDALTLCQLYAEEHHKKIYHYELAGNQENPIKEIVRNDRIIGYEFYTSNGSLVSYVASTSRRAASRRGGSPGDDMEEGS